MICGITTLRKAIIPFAYMVDAATPAHHFCEPYWPISVAKFLMTKPSFLQVPELHEDHVTLKLYCLSPGGEIMAAIIGPYVPHEDNPESESMPIEQAITAAQQHAKSKGCDVVVLDRHNLWDSAHGELV